MIIIQVARNHVLIPIDHLCEGRVQPLGYHWYHLDRAGNRCCGVLSICAAHKIKGEVWKHETVENTVTLRPSLLCEKCGEHGFVTDGEWGNAGGHGALEQYALEMMWG